MLKIKRCKGPQKRTSYVNDNVELACCMRCFIMLGFMLETTMDIEKRILLQVKMEDALEADRMFTLLMGDNVDMRRDFIERYGGQVQLDIYGS